MPGYTTKQQKTIRDCLIASGDRSVTAVEIMEMLHQRGQRVGIATVYRQLEKLEKLGSVHKVVTEEGACYQYCTHGDGRSCFLLKCETCGSISHVDCDQLAALYAHLEQEHRFAINPRKTILYGKCARCQEAQA